jgi:hypothetical protein
MKFLQHLLPDYWLLRCRITQSDKTGTNLSEEAVALDVSCTAGNMLVSVYADPDSVQGPLPRTYDYICLQMLSPNLHSLNHPLCNLSSEAGTMAPVVAILGLKKGTADSSVHEYGGSMFH